MKSAIIYYSFSGNTRKVGKTLAEYLRAKGDVEIIDLTWLDKSDNFFTQALRAFWRKPGQIASTEFNLAKFDLLCFGTPVWAFAPSPAMNAYLSSCFGVEGKEAVLFTTYGSGTGNDKCIDYMQELLDKKGVRSFKRFSVQQAQAADSETVINKIKESGL